MSEHRRRILGAPEEDRLDMALAMLDDALGSDVELSGNLCKRFGLTRQESLLCAAIVAKGGRPLTHRAAFDAIVPMNSDVQPGIVSVVIRGIRKKLPREFQIRSLWGVGYFFEGDAKKLLDSALAIPRDVAWADRHKGRWDPEEDMMLRRLVTDGLSKSHIALALHRTERAVSDRMVAINLNHRAWTREDISLLMTMQANGRPLRDIAVALNMPDEVVQGKLTHLCLQCR